MEFAFQTQIWNTNQKWHWPKRTTEASTHWVRKSILLLVRRFERSLAFGGANNGLGAAENIELD